MAKNSAIRWSKDDYRNLRNAINQFNRKLNRISSEENQNYLPEQISYKTAKANITTRAELNRYINSVRRFSKENAESLYVTQGRG